MQWNLAYGGSRFGIWVCRMAIFFRACQMNSFTFSSNRHVQRGASSSKRKSVCAETATKFWHFHVRNTIKTQKGRGLNTSIGRAARWWQRKMFFHVFWHQSRYDFYCISLHQCTWVYDIFELIIVFQCMQWIIPANMYGLIWKNPILRPYQWLNYPQQTLHFPGYAVHTVKNIMCVVSGPWCLAFGSCVVCFSLEQTSFVSKKGILRRNPCVNWQLDKLVLTFSGVATVELEGDIEYPPTALSSHHVKFQL